MEDMSVVSCRAFSSWAFAAIAILVWGVTFASTRTLLADFSALEIIIIRFAMAWAALGVIGALTRKVKAVSFSWRNEIVFAAMGLSGVAVYQFLENCAIYYTNASNVAILVSFGPIVTAILTRIISKDRSLSFPLIIGSLVAVVGVALIALNGVVEFCLRPIGDLMALAAMVSWGFYSILMDKMNRRGISQLVVVRKSFFWALVMMLPFAIWGVTDSGFYAIDGSFSITLDADINAERFSRPLNWLNLGFLGVLASAACFVMWNAACKSLGVVRTTIGLYLTPIVGIVFAVIMLGEHLTMMSATGCLVIMLGIAIANKNFLRRAK